MKYELAKKLKDAGFQTNNWTVYSRGDGKYYDDYDLPNGINLPNPNLEELIEACGTGLDEIVRNYSDPKQTINWICRSYSGKRIIETRAGTLIEAVADMWLSLNKK